MSLKIQIIRSLSWFLYYTRSLALFNLFVNRFQVCINGRAQLTCPIVKKRRSRNFQVLVYHRVNNEYDPFFMADTIEVFSKQIEYLASHFNICSLEDIVERLKMKDVPENAVVITFDDGYRDIYLNAFPILKKLSIPATIFLPTDSIGTGKVLWHDRVFSAFRETQELFLEGYGDNAKRYTLGTLEGKLIAQEKVLQFLRSLSDCEKPYWINRLMEKLRVEDRKEVPDLMLTWDEVKEMYKGGISFGAHTVTHPILSRLSTDKARAEIYESKEIIEEKLGTPVKTFAYPNGNKEDFNEATKNILKDAGYICALTTIFGTNENGQDLFELRRGGPWEEHLPSFAMKLNLYKFCS